MNEKGSIVFIGDSITEAGRRKDPEQMGYGYVRLIRDYLLTGDPQQPLAVVNRGVSGNRIPDLLARWERDVIALQPSFVSISIGINDVWRQLDHPEKEQVYPKQFEEIYMELAWQTKAKTYAHLILMEPTIIGEAIHSEGNRKLKPYVNIVRKVAHTFHGTLVPTHQAFLAYLQARPSSRYRLTTDGVHMNSLGNMLMARTWLTAFDRDRRQK
ncbi:SGNH/GDSL hydrolase family protein [Anoxybacteroides rupiense]|uniref:SGNH/GDSL hydrolase family protein n=1 Tax=Anoxybacteroides rupiense TaxID=311460 RepID=UPI001BADBB6F|nr:SGNH/GDSL hydrolase family protein [Anoxybacillus rupiensis]MBS2770328.1 SGNH/GDSL hydrolase family protein [Anoxybacillus rupiensis]